MEALIEKLESLKTATKSTVDLLKSLFVKTQFKKGWMFDNGAWQSIPMLYYISKGLVKGSVEHKDTSNMIWMLEKGFLIPSPGFFSQNGSSQTIEFMKPTQAYLLNLVRVEKLAEQDVNLYKMLLEIYEEKLFEAGNRELMLRITNATERLAYFKNNNPELEKVMTDDQVAQMLRIEKKYYYTVKRDLNGNL